jgi:hypothetical protein
VNLHATGAKPPTQVITIHDLDREIDALRAQEQAWKREAQRFEAMIKEIRPQLHALVALKKSLTVRRVAQAGESA